MVEPLTVAIVALVGSALTAALARAARRAAAGGHARGLGTRARWRLPRGIRARVEIALADSAIDMGPEEACELTFACAIGAAVLSFAVVPPFAPVVAIGGVAAGPVALWSTRGRARARFEAELPAALERIASALRGGLSLTESIESQMTEGPVALDLRRVHVRQGLGLGFAEAIAQWPRERPMPAVRAAAGALAVAATMGGRSAAAIDGLATSLRANLAAAADARSLSAQARLSAVVVGAAPIGYLLFSAAVDPSSIDLLIGTGIGRACLIAGLLLELAGVVWMRHIVGKSE